MNTVLWILQVALALFCLAGGGYKIVKFDEIANMPAVRTMPRGAWTAIGAFEIVAAILLVAPAATGWMPILVPIAATAIALEGLALSALYARYSTKLAASNPLVFSAGMMVVAAIVACGRYALA